MSHLNSRECVTIDEQAWLRELEALTRMQAHLFSVRRMAAEFDDVQKRHACLRIADAIELRAREQDQSALALYH